MATQVLLEAQVDEILLSTKQSISTVDTILLFHIVM